MNLQYLILEDKATDNEKLNLVLNSIAKEIKDKNAIIIKPWYNPRSLIW